MSMESQELLAESGRPLQATNLAPQQTPVRTCQRGKAKVFFPAMASAVLLWACYFPLGWGWLGWVALVPLLCLVQTTASARRVYLAAWACGLLCFGAALQWLRVADERMYLTWAALAFYCSLFLPAGIYLVRWLDRRTGMPLILTVPAVWTALEYFRAHFGTGFPWYFLAHSQHNFLPIIQIADLAGAYAVTFVLAAVNALLFECLHASRPLRAWLSLREPACPMSRTVLCSHCLAVLLVLGAVLGYGVWRLSQNQFAVGPRLALIQGNLPQRIRNDAADAGQVIRRHYRELCDEAANQQPKPDLLVWPETSFPDGWADISADLPPDRIPPAWNREVESCRALAQVLAAHWKTALLLGLNRDLLGPDGVSRSYNSAVLIEPNGQEAGCYDKIHRVPFGEYVPLRDWLPWMNAFAPYDFDYSISAGWNLTRFRLGRYCFGVVICFEDTDPYLARQYVRADLATPPVDFLLNISNDGWFDGTSEHDQHLAICRFRAVECRRAVARAVNMGISAMIDSNGRVVALPGPTWARSKKMSAVLTANIPIDNRASLYARWGDWLPAACWLVIGGGLLWGTSWVIRQRREK
jgi:apolipoprotein N-acyltransferase